MTLLLTFIAAVIASAIWFFKDRQNRGKMGTLALIYWGASLMWTVDLIAELFSGQSRLFFASGTEILDDLLLGICVIALGLGIWLVLLIAGKAKGLRKDRQRA